MYREVDLFEIPIYLLEENKYYEKVDSKFLRRVKHLTDIGNTEKGAVEITTQLFPNVPWRFNQIIGYLIVSVSKHDMYFNLFYPTNNKIRYDGSKKHTVIKQCCYHFQIEPNMTNVEIINEMISWIKNIEQDQLKHRNVLDQHIINNTIHYIDIRKIVDNIQE